MRSSAHTLAAVGGLTVKGQAVGAGAASEFRRQRDQVESPGSKGGGRWSWRFGLCRRQGPWRRRERSFFTFLGKEQEEGVAWLEECGEDGGDNGTGEEVEMADQVRYEVQDR